MEKWCDEFFTISSIEAVKCILLLHLDSPAYVYISFKILKKPYIFPMTYEWYVLSICLFSFFISIYWFIFYFVVKATTLFGKTTKAVVWGMQTRAVQGMLDFDYVCSREQPSVAAMIYPFT